VCRAESYHQIGFCVQIQGALLCCRLLSNLIWCFNTRGRGRCITRRTRLPRRQFGSIGLVCESRQGGCQQSSAREGDKVPPGRQGVTGGSGFNKTSGIAISGSIAYVTNTGRNSVSACTISGSTLTDCTSST
jgi:hypothetical protein